jgi:UDP-N-acetylglucosamine--N-acetylmuramyl-(pentapeptide) pyrophosphoryl-undecaprenol N-acetylglucosamine transferase
MTARIVFTGGGSAGHVTPNLALIERCQQANIPVAYMGSTDGIERGIVASTRIPYHAIATGKLRRYRSWRNLVDPFKIVWGIAQAFVKLGRLRPAVIFAKGGFVSFPVAVAARLRGIPLIVHESDMTPGLANRLCFPLAEVICVNDAKVKSLIKQQHKVMVTGTPLREQLLRGDRARGFAYCRFTEDKPTVLIMGGGLGADKINQTVRAALDRLLERFNVIHLCGKGKTDDSLANVPGYRQFAYVSEELPDLLALADVVISRAGANAVYELLCLRKPHILIPLVRGSRGDQVHNARHFAKLGVSHVLNEADMTPRSLIAEVEQVYADRAAVIQKLTDLNITPANQVIFDLLQARVTSAAA